MTDKGLCVICRREMVLEAAGALLNLKPAPSPICRMERMGAVEEAENRVLPWEELTVRVEMVASEEERVPEVTVLLVIVVFVEESPTVRAVSTVADLPPRYLKSPTVPPPSRATLPTV